MRTASALGEGSAVEFDSIAGSLLDVNGKSPSRWGGDADAGGPVAADTEIEELGIPSGIDLLGVLEASWGTAKIGDERFDRGPAVTYGWARL
jgi:hypothetical protein